MPIIAVMNDKGGCGRTTLALVVALQSLSHAESVGVIENDPLRPIFRWLPEDDRSLSRLMVYPCTGTSELLGFIEQRRRDVELLVVDVGRDIERGSVIELADLVVIPSRVGLLDVDAAMRMADAAAERSSRHVVVINAQGHLTYQSRMIRLLKERNVPICPHELADHPAYAAMFSFRRRLDRLNPAFVADLPAALANAEALTEDLLGRLR